MLRTASLAACFLLLSAPFSFAAPPQKFCRFQAGETIAYGIVEGENIRRIEGDLFGDWKKSDQTWPLTKVKLLVPAEPKHVFAMAGNYKSHLSDGGVTSTITTVTTVVTDGKTSETTSTSETTVETRKSGEVPEKFQTPQPFFKTVSSLAADGEAIVLPAGAEAVHYEAEMVIVIGRMAKGVPAERALDYVFGVTCGNDISAREWQDNDVQWWRAKGSDTFGPCGPFISSGLDYDNLQLTLRLNGEVRQDERTDQLIHGVAETVSFLSRHVTLHPGDLIFTGTPGQTAALKPGDVVEVELEGVGVLRNTVRAEGK